MSLPSARELELELLLTQRDEQISDLTVRARWLQSRRELIRAPACIRSTCNSTHFTRRSQCAQDDLSNLRLHLQATPAHERADRDEPVTLPRPVVSLLVKHLASSNDQASASTSSVATALTQRVQLLQEENDELYLLLRRSETGKLKEQVSSLTQTVASLEAALQGTRGRDLICKRSPSYKIRTRL